MSIEPSWIEILDAVRAKTARGIHTALPAKVLSYDSATGLAEVQIVVELEVLPGEFALPPPLSDVPVLQPRGGGFWAHFPLAADDSVLLVFAEQDPSRWLSTGEQGVPPLQRRHGFYAFAVLGAFPYSAPIVGAEDGKLMLGSDNGVRLVVAADVIQIGSGADAAALASKVESALTAIVTHTHPEIPSGGGPVLPSEELVSLDTAVASEVLLIE